VTRPELVTQLDEIAAMVAGWTGIVPPAIATGRIAERLRALAREVAAGCDPGVESGGGWPEHNPGIVGSDLPPSGPPMQPRAELLEE
jgi:hypothetical protein